ncbi:MAG: polysaccharide deacetylase family protein, partial [Gammaproteobacteria bacterium]|nr:polysaccharide deacetylase family protein [Gammaproteobacteria bacterium]
MTPLRTRLLQLGLDALYYSRLSTLLDARTGGIGAIFMLHHVRDGWAPPDFAPNRSLEVASDFLDRVITEVAARGYEFVDLDEAQRRVIAGGSSRRFACFTLDDGYADNYLHALPVFRRHGVPFTIYLNSGLPDGTTVLWWRVLEHVIAAHDEIHVDIDGQEQRFYTRIPAAKYRAFKKIYQHWRPLEPATQRRECRALGDRYGVDPAALCRDVALTWDQLRDLRASGLATIGAHTVSHTALTALTPDEIAGELTADADAIERELGERPRHFAYPYGDAASAAAREFSIVGKLGFGTATTTRKGVLFPEHAQHLHALPRVSLNGDFQKT